MVFGFEVFQNIMRERPGMERALQHEPELLHYLTDSGALRDAPFSPEKVTAEEYIAHVNARQLAEGMVGGNGRLFSRLEMLRFPSSYDVAYHAHIMQILEQSAGMSFESGQLSLPHAK